MKEGLIKDAYELIIKELQTIITILYLLMVGIGMLFNDKKYSLFEINIFEYADVFDFLIAPFQDVQIIIVSVLALLVPLSIFWLGLYIKKRFPKLYSFLSIGLHKRHWYKKLRLVLFGFLLLYFVVEAANGYGSFKKNNIDLEPTVAVKFTNDDVMEGKIIGKTKEVLFLYTENKVKIIPFTSVVKEIEIQ